MSVPQLQPGTVLQLQPADWRYGRHLLLLRVGKIRTDLSRYYDDEWVWIEGTQLAHDHTPIGRMEALVRTDAIVGAIIVEPL